MEENVALDSKKQKKFNKSIQGIKKLLKKNEEKADKPAVLAPKNEESKGDKKKSKRKEKGLVYLSHIPHGFYEHEMTQYFKQFGMVTNVRVIRSARTGRSKGYAFVEFREPAVAEIVAETMNNYLMGKRLIKAAIIPPEKQRHRAFRKHWTSRHNPTADRRIKEKKIYNANKTDAEHLKKAKKMLSNIQKTKKKLSELGINYDFFTPVDIPQPLLQINTKESKTQQPKATEENNKKGAKKAQDSAKVKQNKKQKKMQDAGVKLPENFIEVGADSGDESDSSIDFDSDEYEKMLGDDSDVSSGDDSGDEDGKESGDEDDDEGESDDDDSDEELPPLVPIKGKKSKKPIVALPPQPKASKTNTQKVQKAPPPQAKKSRKPTNGPIVQNALPQPKKTQKPINEPAVQKAYQESQKPTKVAKVQKVPQHQPQGLKRKHQQPEVTPKKPKFEKKDKPRNKQFKKKNKA